MSTFFRTGEDVVLSAAFGPQERIAFKGVSSSILSIARYSGAAMVDRKRFTYMPATDELIRDDVLRFLKNYRRCQERARHELADIGAHEQLPLI